MRPPRQEFALHDSTPARHDPYIRRPGSRRQQHPSTRAAVRGLPSPRPTRSPPPRPRSTRSGAARYALAALPSTAPLDAPPALTVASPAPSRSGAVAGVVPAGHALSWPASPLACSRHPARLAGAGARACGGRPGSPVSGWRPHPAPNAARPHGPLTTGVRPQNVKKINKKYIKINKTVIKIKTNLIN